MLKKLASLMAILVFVSACDTTASDEGSGAKFGKPGCQCLDEVHNVSDRVFFNFGKSTLTPEARATLDHQAIWLKKYASIHVTIEGHCDERGTREYNLALGEHRATAVRNYLIADGFDADRIKAISYGKEHPDASGHDEEAWAKNRRAVTVVEKQ